MELISCQPCDNFPLALGCRGQIKVNVNIKTANKFFMTCSLYYIHLYREVIYVLGKYIRKENKMKRINKFIIKRQDELLEKEGIHSKEELFSMTVVELIERIGESEIDLLLKRLLLDAYDEKKNFIDSSCVDLVKGHQYVLDTFEAYDFNDNLDWFYKITVEDFLNLEDLNLKKIPFLTYYLKYFVNEGQMIEPEYFRYYDDEADCLTFYINPEVIR